MSKTATPKTCVNCKYFITYDWVLDNSGWCDIKLPPHIVTNGDSTDVPSKVAYSDSCSFWTKKAKASV